MWAGILNSTRPITFKLCCGYTYMQTQRPKKKESKATSYENGSQKTNPTSAQ